MDIDGTDNVGDLRLDSSSPEGGAVPNFTELGVQGNAATFTGVNYLRNKTTELSFSVNDSFSLELWAYFTALPSASPEGKDAYLLEKINTTGEDKGGFRVYARSQTDLFRFRTMDDTGEFADVNSMSTVTLNVWTHIVATYDAGAMTLYINGVPENSATLAFVGTRLSALAEDFFAVGGISTSSTSGIVGKVDEARVYKVALTSEEVSARYDETKPE